MGRIRSQACKVIPNTTKRTSRRELHNPTTARLRPPSAQGAEFASVGPGWYRQCRLRSRVVRTVSRHPHPACFWSSGFGLLVSGQSLALLPWWLYFGAFGGLWLVGCGCHAARAWGWHPWHGSWGWRGGAIRGFALAGAECNTEAGGSCRSVGAAVSVGGRRSGRWLGAAQLLMLLSRRAALLSTAGSVCSWCLWYLGRRGVQGSVHWQPRWVRGSRLQRSRCFRGV